MKRSDSIVDSVPPFRLDRDGELTGNSMVVVWKHTLVLYGCCERKTVHQKSNSWPGLSAPTFSFWFTFRTTLPLPTWHLSWLTKMCPGDLNRCSPGKSLKGLQQYLTCYTSVGKTLGKCFGSLPDAYRCVALLTTTPSCSFQDISLSLRVLS